MSQKKLLINNTISNIFYYGIQAVIVFITFPVVVKYFGKNLYGIYAFILSIFSITQILNISLNMTLTKYVSEFHALHDFLSLQHLINNSYFISLLANCFVALILTTCSFASPEIMHIQKDYWPQFVSIIQILAGFSLINGLAQVPKGILLGLQRYTLANFTTIPVLVGPVLGVILMQFLSLSLIQYVIILQVTILISGIWAYMEVKKVLPAIRHGLKINTPELKRILSFNIYHVLNQISDVLFYTTDKIILQNVAGSVAVANYAVAERPNQLALSFTSLPLSAIVPACSKANAEQNIPLINKMLITGTRLYLFLVLPSLCTLTFLMPRFILVWMGKEFVELALYAQLFMFTMISAASFRVFSHILIGKGRIREIVNIKMVYAAINVVASYLLAKQLGIIGVIIPTLFFWTIVYPVAWLYLMKSEGISLPRFIVKASIPVVSTIGACWIVTAGLNDFFDYSFVSLLVLGTLSLAFTYLMLYIVVINREERIFIKDLIGGYTNRFAQK